VDDTGAVGLVINRAARPADSKGNLYFSDNPQPVGGTQCSSLLLAQMGICKVARW
jgi:hypothetical protein